MQVAVIKVTETEATVIHSIDVERTDRVAIFPGFDRILSIYHVPAEGVGPTPLLQGGPGRQRVVLVPHQDKNTAQRVEGSHSSQRAALII